MDYALLGIINNHLIEKHTELIQKSFVQWMYLINIVRGEIVKKQNQAKGVGGIYNGALYRCRCADMECFNNFDILKRLQAFIKCCFLLAGGIGF